MEYKSIEEVVESLSGQGYGALKARATEAVNNHLRPIREKINYYLNNKDEIRALMQKGADKARVVAQETITRCKKAMGLLQQIKYLTKQTSKNKAFCLTKKS